MKELTVTLVGQDSDIRARLKVMPYAPLSLKAYLDSHLPDSLKDKVKTKVFDFRWDVSPQSMASQILSANPDAVGFSIYIWNYKQIFKCAEKIKDIKKDVVIILGGPQVSPIANDVLLQNPYVDIISFVPGAGEVTLLGIVEAMFYERGFETIEGIYYYDDQRNIIKTSATVRPLDYKTTPSPYTQGDGLFEDDEEYFAIIETSRGCPYDCGYCFWGHGKHRVEYFPLERALRDIEVVYNNPKVKHVYFSDSNLLLNTERTEAIIKHILKQKSPVKTDFEINPIYLKESTAKLMASLPGFRFITAIQSVNPNALKRIGKLRPSPEIFARKLKEVKQWTPNLRHHFDLMLGLPGDDLNGFIQTIDFILSHEPFFIALAYPVYLLPGSRFFENKDALGLRYDPKNPFSIIETDTFPQKDIEKALRVSIWTQILTHYYPSVARFLYDAARVDNVRVQRLLRWIDIMDEKINLFAMHDSLSGVATKSVTEWNKLKKSLLEKASTTESALIIYSSIRNQEESFINKSLGENIRLGCDIFEYMASRGMDSVEFSHFDRLPADITKGFPVKKIRAVFSRYRR